MQFFDPSILESGQYHDWLVQGLILSLQLTASSFVIALPFGAILAVMRTSGFALARGVASTIIEAIRNVPLLAHLLFWYFAFPELLPEGAREFLYAHNPEAVCAVIALSLYSGVHMAEDIRSGIRAVPPSQLEAARSLGLGRLASVRLVLLPQAFRAATPPLLSQTVNLWKDTSVATVIGAAELMYQAARVETSSFRSLEAFSFATLAYLSVSLLISFAAWLFQRRYPVRPA
ncbi:amino acid ABC transporter permease [Massilia sp. LC238]|uniref:amino acid ABC transporter permease n=1 Tax=Massilia sp. LC238 TaxID=1502852 RepID=UPI0004E3FECE|nr:amino acid ABC transporter permease [Massilia sp. LC238]KFC75837.1 His/Glu/Gln/Arg/opine family amino ABC transporter, permease, 3-TM region [Massilia sp. LC238]